MSASTIHTSPPTPPDGKPPDSSPRLPSAWRRFWHRYSPNGEFPLSSCSSLAFHVLILLLLVLMGTVLTRHEPAAPGVDVVQVGDDPDAAAGLQAGGPGDGPSLAETTPNDLTPADLRPQPTEKLQTDVTNDTSQTPLLSTDAVSSTVTQAASKAEEMATKAREGLAQAKERLRKNMSQGGGGTAAGGSGNAGAGSTPGGGGSGATGRAARPGRWILSVRPVSVEDYLTRFQSLQAELAFPMADERYRYYSNLNSRPPTVKVKDLTGDARLYWVEDDRRMLEDLAQYFGIAPTAYMLVFLPDAVEQRLLRMELEYAGRKEDEIAKTTFEIVRRGGGYDVQVVDQKPR